MKEGDITKLISKELLHAEPILMIYSINACCTQPLPDTGSSLFKMGKLWYFYRLYWDLLCVKVHI